jgi:hypothetical protein
LIEANFVNEVKVAAENSVGMQNDSNGLTLSVSIKFVENPSCLQMICAAGAHFVAANA